MFDIYDMLRQEMFFLWMTACLYFSFFSEHYTMSPGLKTTPPVSYKYSVTPI